MTRMELLIRGSFLGLITAEVFVAASYTLLFPSAQFYVRVTVDLSGINNVRKIAPVIELIFVLPVCIASVALQANLKT